MHIMKKRVVITGTGLLTPVGLTVDETWRNILAGEIGIDYITYFDTEAYNVKVAGELKGFDVDQHIESKEIRRLDPYQHYMLVAAREAIAQADLTVTEEQGARTSVLVSSTTGGVKRYAEYMDLIRETGNPRRMSPFAVPMLIVNGGANVLSIEVGARGPSSPPVSACATGADSIGYAYNFIQMGRIDRALAGAADYNILPLGIAAFDRIGALSRETENPKKAMRPFDAHRSGMVMGEGAGVIVMETLESAQQRGATILAELVGYGSSTDAYHRTAPDPDARGAIEAIQIALDDAGVAPEDIDYVNAHGTATALNDEMETLALKKIFGEHAYNLAISSTKSMTGHAMGTTAAFEAVFTTLALRDQIAPPTMNHDTPDPELDLDYVPNRARPMEMEYAISNSFAFGGHNACLVFRRWHDE